jgi:Zinc knuckle
MSALHSACRDHVSFNAINNAISEDVPQGNAHQACLNLHTIFKPTSSAQKLDLEFQFTQCLLIRDTKNSDEWFAEKMITQIIYNILPPAYQITVDLIKRDLNRQVSVTLFQVQEDIRQIYGQLQQNQYFGRQHHSKSRISYHTNDSLLATSHKKTKSLCRTCGKMGHKAADCWDHPKNKDIPRPSRL